MGSPDSTTPQHAQIPYFMQQTSQESNNYDTRKLCCKLFGFSENSSPTNYGKAFCENDYLNKKLEKSLVGILLRKKEKFGEWVGSSFKEDF